MRIGFIGLGRLGLPVAVALAYRGHEVTGYDIDKSKMSLDAFPQYEGGYAGKAVAQHVLSYAEPRMKFAGPGGAILNQDLVFIAIQTPHAKDFEGITPLTDERRDFDYTYLKTAVKAIAALAGDEKVTMVIISTVLPGTLRREIMPLLKGSNIDLIYNPFFIAMGTTVTDFLEPEFILMGREPGTDTSAVKQCYMQAGIEAPIREMRIESAELTKVAYNTFISMKIGVTNVLGEVCHKTLADIDEVSAALEAATTRVAGPAYFRSGMGDAGACHPRDNIAMSWLAQELELHHDPFQESMRMRENHARWLADKLKARGLPIVILGYAYKPNCPLIDGSHAVLVQNILEADGYVVEHFDSVIGRWSLSYKPAAFLIGQKHDGIEDTDFPPGSYVLDPFRIIPDRHGVTVERIGEGK